MRSETITGHEDESPAKRLLFVAPDLPSPTTGGGALRMFHMLRFLGARFEVDLVAPLQGEGGEALNLVAESCREVELVPISPSRGFGRFVRLGPYEKDQALAQAVGRRLASGLYGAVQVEKPAMLPYVSSGSTVPLVLDTWAYGLTGPLRAVRHGTGVLARARAVLQLIRFGLFDRFCWPATHCILVVSEEDFVRCRRSRPDRDALVVPNGVDCKVVRPAAGEAPGDPLLLFTGDMGFAPNVDAALMLAEDIFPTVRRSHPDACLRLVGRNPSPRILELAGPGIVVTGEVPDMVPHLHAATVYVAPLFTGAGTRTKLLEAMAAGLAIVTTSIGIEGIAAGHERQVLIADDRASLASAVCRLLDERALCERLGAAARRLAEERYDWPCCLAPLARLYAELLPAKAASC